MALTYFVDDASSDQERCAVELAQNLQDITNLGIKIGLISEAVITPGNINDRKGICHYAGKTEMMKEQLMTILSQLEAMK
jgi:hypothetical protein